MQGREVKQHDQSANRVELLDGRSEILDLHTMKPTRLSKRSLGCWHDEHEAYSQLAAIKCRVLPVHITPFLLESMITSPACTIYSSLAIFTQFVWLSMSAFGNLAPLWEACTSLTLVSVQRRGVFSLLSYLYRLFSLGRSTLFRQHYCDTTMRPLRCLSMIHRLLRRLQGAWHEAPNVLVHKATYPPSVC